MSVSVDSFQDPLRGLISDWINRHKDKDWFEEWAASDGISSSANRFLWYAESVFLSVYAEMVDGGTIPGDNKRFPSSPKRDLPDIDYPMKGNPVVYRHFDKDNRLLYVGYSINSLSRQITHRKYAIWWGEVELITFTRYNSSQEALDAELVAIRTEHPLHNIRGKIEK